MPHLNKMLGLMLKELGGIMPPPPKFEIKTLEGTVVKQIITLFMKLVKDSDSKQGAMLDAFIPKEHIIFQADRKPDKTREALVLLGSILDDYKNKIRRIE